MPRPKHFNPPRFGNRPPALKTRGVLGSVKLEPVPFDPAVDCPPYGCFNCRVIDEHLSKDCRKPVLYEFCMNCGRRGLDVRQCPRCSKGYIEQFGPRPFRRHEAEPPAAEVSQKVDRKLPVGMSPLPKPTKKQRSDSLSSQSPQVSPEKVPPVELQKSNSTSDSAVGSEIGDEYFYADEDLDEIIIDEDLDGLVVDEEETPAMQPQTSDAVQAFVSLFDMMRHLPIETQNKVVMQFAEEQKVLAGQR